MKVYLICGIMVLLVGCRGLSLDTNKDESRVFLEDLFSSKINSDFSYDAQLDKRGIDKDDVFSHSHCANLKAKGFCKYSLIKDNYCYTTCRCEDILSKDSCKKIKERNECPKFHEHCKITCQKCECTPEALGMESGALPNANITASSVNRATFEPYNGRLNFKGTNKRQGCWSPRTNSVGEWIQVDVGKLTKVTAVAIQGRHGSDQWVKSFSLQYSVDGKTFKDYEKGKVFVGNSNRDTVIKHDLEPPMGGRYFRLLPKSWHSNISMRMELYGCKF